MHNAPDRDQYIKINWENMPDKKKYDFIQYSFDKDFDVSSFGETYDYNSVLHINSLAYSINGRPTVEPTVKYFQNELLYWNFKLSCVFVEGPKIFARNWATHWNE